MRFGAGAAGRGARARGMARRARRAPDGMQGLGCPGNQLDQLEQQGHDVEVLLRGAAAFVDQAHTPAAFAYRSVDDWSTSAPQAYRISTAEAVTAAAEKSGSAARARPPRVGRHPTESRLFVRYGSPFQRRSARSGHGRGHLSNPTHVSLLAIN